MYSALRMIERWLQEHLFKVGWLLTKNLRITTIFYYTIFLPGVFLYEVTLFLAASALDVRAEQSLEWPEAQQTAELKLNFVKLARKTPAYKQSLISIAPTVTGLLVIWFILSYILDIQTVLDTFQSETTVLILNRLSTSIAQLTSAPDFWFWVWIIFAISNTMLPDTSIFKNGRWVIIAGIVVVLIPLFFLGVGEQVVGYAVSGPLTVAINVLSIVFGTMIFLDVVIVAVLGTIEALIERFTGDSATFVNGKMVTMTREEAVAQRKQARAKERQRRQKAQKPALPQGPPSVYALVLPIPGAPGKEPVTQLTSGVMLDETATPEPEKLQRPQREEPDVIEGETISNRFDSIRFNVNRPDEAIDEDQEEDLDDTSTAETVSPPAERSLAQRLGAGRVQPAPTDSEDEDEDKEEDDQPSLTSRLGTSRLGSSPSRPSSSPFQRSASTDDDSEDDKEGQRSTASAPNPFKRSSAGSRPSAFDALRNTDTDEDEDDEEDQRSTASAPNPFNRSSAGSRPSAFDALRNTDTDEDEEENDDDQPSLASRLGASRLGTSRPTSSPFQRSTSIDDDTDEDEGDQRSTASAPNPFDRSSIGSRPSAFDALRNTDSDDDEDEDKEEDDQPSLASRLGASRFGSSRPSTSPFPRRANANDDSDDDEESSPSPFSSSRSRFSGGGLSSRLSSSQRPPTSGDSSRDLLIDDDDEKEDDDLSYEDFEDPA